MAVKKSKLFNEDFVFNDDNEPRDQAALQQLKRNQVKDNHIFFSSKIIIEF